MVFPILSINLVTPKIIFSDFDGTLTLNELLGPSLFEILDFLKKKKVPLVVVSGRSLSWGHFLLTHLPHQNEAIMEGGGVILKKNSDGFIEKENLVPDAELDHLENIAKEIPGRFGVSLTADSFGRLSDRAIELHDLRKDPAKAEKIKEFLDEQGANFSESNVHLNFWCGEISKYKAVNYFLENYYENVSQKDCLYFGDSLNDESMFENFTHSIGVSNIKSVLARLVHKPSVILEGEKNAGPHGMISYLQDLLK